ncbi:MAG: hypothetical protein QOG16_818, partial [Actinomycetota bacterium]|nr:hypothetical protein [Actinomycetota bacterium]
MDLLKRSWSRLRSHQAMTDWVIAVALLVLMELDTLRPDDFIHGPRGLYALMAVAMTVPLVGRRRFPIGVASAVTAAFVFQGWADGNGQPSDTLIIPWLFAIYSMGAHAREERRWWAAAVSLAASLAWWGPDDFLLPIVVFGGAFVAGRHVRTRQLLAEALEARNEALEEQQANAEQVAIANERARIARDLHDLVAHSMSVIAVQAGGERMRLKDRTDPTVEVLTVIERTARQGLTEMRRLVEVLREGDGSELGPQPSLRRMDDLLANARFAGLDVEIDVEGELTGIPPSVDLSAYRIVQEALTNAAKHAAPATARIRVRRSHSSLELEVEDNGSYPDRLGVGFGLIGIEERVAAYGGSVETGRS